MKPKTLTRLLAAGGLASLAALHWLPKKYLPFGSRTASAALLVGLILAVHRNPLRALFRDAKNVLEKSMKEAELNTLKLVTSRTASARK
ncbi:MAG: hypothetical protein AB1473_01745 [Thermodesulfobacteriota bacterium]